jgi:hypothetical protein
MNDRLTLRRCITGVLTKPDRIPAGDEETWLSLIRNERESLENNWYCVKQPGPTDLQGGITWADARKRENEFFSTMQPWNELDEIYQKYLRTGNLVERLSSILSDLISKRYVNVLGPRTIQKNLIIFYSLPEIQEELERSILSTWLTLQTLPNEPSKDPQNEISNLLHGFVTDLTRHVEGVPDKDGLLQTIRPAHKKFRSEIRGTAPEFLPFERQFAEEKRIRKATFLRDEEGEELEQEGPEQEGPEQEQELATMAVLRNGWDEYDDDEGSHRDSDDDEIVRSLREGNRRANIICIDEVFERAHQ